MSTHTAPVERPLWNPYVAGIGLGLVLLATFVIMGFGLGASSAVTRTAVAGLHAVAPTYAETNSYFSQYFGDAHILEDWMVFEVLGVLLGGLLGAYSGGRLKFDVQKGPRISVRGRLGWALAGGVIMGFAARLGRGCTSGQALTGGSTFVLGSWIFMIAVFVGGYALAPLMRRQWR
ncbi:MAG: YeeE/YedE family protein [Myxococcales bacterium]|nr:YeeE/YedE family protein [Myxococcales bacterium]MCB9521751.1 YeeE/YedE family protein [Myxococcales bacterium]